MRKVLLATTALVMMGGVSAAYADISVSGGHELKYQSWSKKTSTTANNSKVSSGATYTISGSSVLDNGMTISGKIYSDNAAAFNTQGFSISDDWGTIGVKDSESGDAFATSVPSAATRIVSAKKRRSNVQASFCQRCTDAIITRGA